MSNISVVKAASVVRGCGSRVKGGLYACCATSPYGKPLEHFLIDPPTPYSGDPFRAPIVKDNNLIFWVGKEYYPYCPDFIEEARVYGVSKRIPLSGANMEGIEPFKSKMFFIHPLAIIDVVDSVHNCPKGFADHIEGADRCITELYYHVEAEKAGDGSYSRTIGSTVYRIPAVKSGDAKYSPGLFLWLPFTHFEYVLPDDNKVDERVERAIEKGANIVCIKEE